MRGDTGSKIRDGAIVVTREVDRKEIPADQVTLSGERSEDGRMTMWMSRESMDSDKIILPPGKLSESYGKAYQRL